MNLFAPGRGSPEYLTWTDTTYTAYVAEVRAIGMRMREHLIERKLAYPTDSALKSSRRLPRAVFELGHNLPALKKNTAIPVGKFGPFPYGVRFVHPNGFINDKDAISVPVAEVNRDRQWMTNTKLVVPKRSLQGSQATWYDPTDIIEFSRPLILPIHIAPADLVSRHQSGDIAVDRYINSSHLVVATDTGQIGHVWDFTRLPNFFRVGHPIGSTGYHFESLPSVYGRILAREVIAAESAKS